ncbi:hypothetical protein D3C84_1001970 [compost metagenome]
MDPVFPAEFLAELTGDQVQWLLLHRAAFDSILGAFGGAGEGLQSVLHQRDQRRLAAADRAHEQQQPLADIEALGSRAKIFLHQQLNGIFQPKQGAAEKFVLSPSVTQLVHAS